MLGGIVVDVVYVPRQVGFIADRMFPKSALPDIVLSTRVLPGAKAVLDGTAGE
jgi:hypothetical protein